MTMAMGTIFSAAACNETAAVGSFMSELPNYETVKSLEFDSWLGPKTTDQMLKDYADCGYTVYHLQSGSFSTTDSTKSDAELNEWLDRIFTMSKKYGLKVVLAPTAVNTSATSIIPFEYTYSRVGETLEKWKDDDTFYGFMPSDETTLDKPLSGSRDQYLKKDYEQSIDFLLDDYLFFSSKFPGKYFETTLLGIPNGTDSNMPYFNDGRPNFDEYMDVYYDGLVKYMPLEERVYSFDAYPFYERNGKLLYQDRFVGSLEQVALRAEAAGAEKATYMQDHIAVLNGEEIDYQYFTSMAFGYTHFTTYCYMDEWGEKTFSATNAGTLTENYYYYQRAHQKVKSMEAVYSNFCDRRVGTIGVTGQTPGATTWSKCIALSENLPYVGKVKCEYDLLMSAFTDQDGNYGYMLANQYVPDDVKTNTIEVTFNGANRVAVWVDGNAMEIVDAPNGKLSLTLASGGGAFVIPMN